MLSILIWIMCMLLHSGVLHSTFKVFHWAYKFLILSFHIFLTWRHNSCTQNSPPCHLLSPFTLFLCNKTFLCFFIKFYSKFSFKIPNWTETIFNIYEKNRITLWKYFFISFRTCKKIEVKRGHLVKKWEYGQTEKILLY